MIIFNNVLKRSFKDLKKTLKKAGLAKNSDQYIQSAELFSLIFSIIICGFFSLVFIKERWPILGIVVIFVISFFLFFILIMNIPKLRVNSQRIQLESDLLYSTRFLILKMESGSPLLNGLIEVSKLHTKSSKFFKEIVSDVYLGTPIEEAIENAIERSPSKAFSKILEEIRNSLKTGADIEKSLKATLEDLTKKHIIEIKAYGRKLSPISMFYMIIGTIAPSIGSALLVVASGFLPGVISKIDIKVFAFLFFIMVAIQGFFILLFKAMKPQVMT